jgi:HEAT repeat protein
MGQLAIVLVAFVAATAFGETLSPEEIARGLSASTQDREITLKRLDASVVPMLLLWTKRPPEVPFQRELPAGMAEAFARFPTKEAIPFLIEHIDVDSTFGIWLAPWAKTPSVVIDTFPAVKALLRIGSQSRRPLIDILKAGGLGTGDGRLAAIFTIGRLGKSKEGIECLRSLKSQSKLEEFWRQYGLARMTGSLFMWNGERVTER